MPFISSCGLQIRVLIIATWCCPTDDCGLWIVVCSAAARSVVIHINYKQQWTWHWITQPCLSVRLTASQGKWPISKYVDSILRFPFGISIIQGLTDYALHI